MDKTKEEGNRTRILKQEWALPFPYAVHDVLGISKIALLLFSCTCACHSLLSCGMPLLLKGSATYSTSTSELRVAVDRKSPCQTPVECERRELGTWSCTDAPDASHERLQVELNLLVPSPFLIFEDKR